MGVLRLNLHSNLNKNHNLHKKRMFSFILKFLCKISTRYSLVDILCRNTQKRTYNSTFRGNFYLTLTSTYSTYFNKLNRSFTRVCSLWIRRLEVSKECHTELTYRLYNKKLHFICCKTVLLRNMQLHIINTQIVFEISYAGATINRTTHSKQLIDLGTAVVMQLNSNWLPRSGDRGRTSPLTSGHHRWQIELLYIVQNGPA